MINTATLRSKIKARGLSIQQLSSLLSMDQSTFHRKINKNGAGFTVVQAQELARVLKLTPQEAMSVFFDQSCKQDTL